MRSSVFTFTLSALLLTACAHKEEKKEHHSASLKNADITPPPVIQGSRYVTLVFPSGKSEVGETNRRTLKEFQYQIHREARPINEIRVLAWSDAEYPDKVMGKLAKQEENLAETRARNIKNYLENDLKELSDVHAYNMARRPDLMSKILRDDEYDIKEAFEQSGTTSSRLPGGDISYTKASKALIIIDYEGGKDNQKR